MAMDYFLSHIMVVIPAILIQWISQAGEKLIAVLRSDKKSRSILGHYWFLVSMGIVASGFFTDAIGSQVVTVFPFIVFLFILFLGWLVCIYQIQTIIPRPGKRSPKKKRVLVRSRVNMLGMYSLSMAILLVFLGGEIW